MSGDRRSDRELVSALERHRPLRRWALPANDLERELMRCQLDRYREMALDDLESDRGWPIDLNRGSA